MKRTATPFLLARSLLLSAASATAQTSFRIGVRGDANYALTTKDAASTTAEPSFYTYSASKSSLLAWQAGVVGEVNFGKLAFQPALVFSQKGEQFRTTIILDGIVRTSDERTSANRYNWLELPLNVVYTLHGNHAVLAAYEGLSRGRTSSWHGHFYWSKLTRVREQNCLRF